MERGYCPPQTVNGFCIRIMQGEEYGKIYQLSELIKYGILAVTNLNKTVSISNVVLIMVRFKQT